MFDGPSRVHPDAAVQPRHGRKQNLSLVLQELHTGGAMSRAELARRLGLTKVTVSTLVAELLDSGHAVEIGLDRAGRPGKRATLVDVNRDGWQILGVDLADPTAFRAGVLDLNGHVVARAERPVGSGEGPSFGESVLTTVCDLVREIAGKATAPLLGLGVGTPGVVGPTGVVTTAPNLGWNQMPLRRRLAELTGLTVLVSNDADAAAHAEYTHGNGVADMILVKIGRGVGCGVIVGGQRVRGAHSAAGEIGHVTVGTEGGARCRCGKVGCLETWLSVPNLDLALAQTTDPELPLREAGERLGIALAPVVAALDLAEVVLTGPERLIGGALLDALARTLRERLLAHKGSGLSIRMATDSEDIVLRGAAALVLWDQLGVA